MTRQRGLAAAIIHFRDDVQGYYSTVRQLASGAGAFHDEDVGAWIVVDFEPCKLLAESDRLLRNRVELPPQPNAEDLRDFAQGVFDTQIMFRDDSEATRERRKWFKALSRESTSTRSLHKLANDAISSLRIGERLDLYARVLQPYASSVICETLGIPTEEQHEMGPFIHQLVRFLDGRLRNATDITRALYAVAWLYDRLGRSLARRERAYQDFALADFMLTLVAGHESIAYALATLVVHGGAWDTSRETEPFEHGMDAAIREALRFDSPVQMLGRIVGEAGAELPNGQTVPDGTRIYLHLGAANRDPRRFERPSVFDPSHRQPGLAFGAGSAHCVGQVLALKAMRSFAEAMDEQGIRLQVERNSIRWDGGFAGRAFAALPVVPVKRTSCQRSTEANGMAIHRTRAAR